MGRQPLAELEIAALGVQPLGGNELHWDGPRDVESSFVTISIHMHVNDPITEVHVVSISDQRVSVQEGPIRGVFQNGCVDGADDRGVLKEFVLLGSHSRNTKG